MIEIRTERLNILHASLEDMRKRTEVGDEFAREFYEAALADMDNCQWYNL